MSTDIPFVTETDFPFDADDNFTSTWNGTEPGFNDTGVTNGTDVTTAVGLDFLDSFVKALTAMLVSELGDKTFFLAGIIAWYGVRIHLFLIAHVLIAIGIGY